MSIPRLTSRRAFTLIELLAAIGVILVLAALTTFGVRRIANDARMSSAKNTLTAVLANARALAMKENTIVAVVFRAQMEGREQQIEVVLAKWTGESPVIFEQGNPEALCIDRFVPILDVPPRRLPRGIMVAGPRYHSTGSATNTDAIWTTQTHLPSVTTGEATMRVIGVMFGPDGTMITRNSRSAAIRFWVDFDRDALQQIDGLMIDYESPPTPSVNQFRVFFMLQEEEDDEPYVNVVPFLAVFDDVAARERYNVAAWTDFATKENNLTEYITENADPIHFNRYTGVIVK